MSKFKIGDTVKFKSTDNHAIVYGVYKDNYWVCRENDTAPFGVKEDMLELVPYPMPFIPPLPSCRYFRNELGEKFVYDESNLWAPPKLDEYFLIIRTIGIFVGKAALNFSDLGHRFILKKVEAWRDKISMKGQSPGYYQNIFYNIPVISKGKDTTLDIETVVYQYLSGLLGNDDRRLAKDVMIDLEKKTGNI